MVVFSQRNQEPREKVQSAVVTRGALSRPEPNKSCCASFRQLARDSASASVQVGAEIHFLCLRIGVDSRLRRVEDDSLLDAFCSWRMDGLCLCYFMANIAHTSEGKLQLGPAEPLYHEGSH